MSRWEGERRVARHATRIRKPSKHVESLHYNLESECETMETCHWPTRPLLWPCKQQLWMCKWEIFYPDQFHCEVFFWFSPQKSSPRTKSQSFWNSEFCSYIQEKVVVPWPEVCYFLSKLDSLWCPWFWCRFLFIFFVSFLCFNYTSSWSYSHSYRAIKSQSSFGGMIRTAPWFNYDNFVFKTLEGQVNLLVLKLRTSTT